MLQKLRTVIYHVPELEKAKAWFTAFTGMAPYFDEPFYVGYEVNGYELGLDPDCTNVEKGNHTVAYWSVASIHEAVAKATAIGGTIVEPVHNVGGTVEVAIVADPFGNHIGLITGA